MTAKCARKNADQSSLLEKANAYLSKLSKATRDEAVAIVEDMIENWEAAAILTLAAIGISAKLGDITMIIPLPLFIEKRMVIPVIAVVVVLLLTGSLQRKMQRRRTRADGNL